jgi:outer membrane protein assembly factor BamA
VTQPRCIVPLGFGVILLMLWTVPSFGQTSSATTPDTSGGKSLFISAEDGWMDISGFLDTQFGFLPIVAPISEPAVGYGAAAALTFLSKPAGNRRPNVTAAGGFGTTNGTWGAFAADSRYWLDQHLQTLGVLVYTSVNLDYYGMGSNSPLANNPLRYTLKPIGGVMRGKYRIGESDFWGGLGYGFVSMEVSFDIPNAPNVPEYSNKTNIAELTPSIAYDTRDNIFTPLKGTYLEASGGFSNKAFGGDTEFQRVQFLAMQFVPLPAEIFLGLRGQVSAAYGDPPFYVKPFIYMRGVPAMRYQGDKVAQMEAELRWQFWNRISLVGFAGGGGAWTKVKESEQTQTTFAGGAGFRYELARKYGIHVGLDAAFGPTAGPTIYIVMGSAWMGS